MVGFELLLPPSPPDFGLSGSLLPPSTALRLSGSGVRRCAGRSSVVSVDFSINDHAGRGACRSSRSSTHSGDLNVREVYFHGRRSLLRG
eukprot:scaffold82798_cov23-Phaeocystis_antarctica.AAC.1